MDLYTDLTDAQKRALKENADDLEKLRGQVEDVRREAMSRLKAAGLGNGTVVINCLICTVCEGWSEGDDRKCDSCSHRWFSHNVI
ncbi:hypothetical protein ABZZ79_06930 [Streptomyces sp. NPDC006458]|uniref:hypothetical protein n=1 Tax=Streptomyces sp. NPDC006458 TaxID=3154302 RepID=UPI0033A6D879